MNELVYGDFGWEASQEQAAVFVFGDKGFVRILRAAVESRHYLRGGLVASKCLVESLLKASNGRSRES